MLKINAYTLRTLDSSEVFVFKVIACSNDVDRDHEAFTTQALKTLAELYKGKTMILNHENRTENQVARIYDAEVVADETKTTALGESYTTLVLHVFIPRIAKNEDFIAEIEAGVKKEVSVGCACRSRTCSICGMEAKGYSRNMPCGHCIGQEYDGNICAARLDKIADAYEVSFVAIPAQRDAGTTKAAESSQQKETEKSIFSGFLQYLKN